MPGRNNNYNRPVFAALIGFALASDVQADPKLVLATHADAVQAIWQVQQLEFSYYSPSTSYTCEGLKKRIRAVLQAVGVHESMSVEIHCEGRAVNAAEVRISFAAPVAATEENIRAATTFQGHELLAARMKGIALPTPTDIERFAASWQPVSLSHLQISNGDCDLLNGLRGQVFPKLQVRNARGFTCSVGPTRLKPNPTVEALVRAQPVDHDQ
jgi:hypothetical protein